MKTTKKKALTLKSINKSNVWDIQENDVFRLLNTASKDPELKDNINRYFDTFKSAFSIEQLPIDKKEVIKKFEDRGYKVSTITIGEDKKKWCIKKRPINRITDLTYENIRHISVSKLLEVLESNFGGGWDSISQSIKDIIESGFEISTTTLPKERLRKKGGMYDKKVSDGFEVLEIQKGGWIEAIFAKVKPVVIMQEEKEQEKPTYTKDLDDEGNEDNYSEMEENEYEDDEFYSDEEEEKMLEESYHTSDVDMYFSENGDEQLIEDSFSSFDTDSEELNIDSIVDEEYNS